MANAFNKVGIIGKQRGENLSETLTILKNYLLMRGITVYLDQETDSLLPDSALTLVPRDRLGSLCDLIIVVGGDGSFLNAARFVVDSQIPVLGINRGRLGFLTDIRPQELEAKIGAVLDGEYIIEKRFLLTATFEPAKHPAQTALNDVVLLPGDVAHMIEFEVFIQDQFVCSQRADGLIIATPTGSTAYALSGGGPILHPSLDAVVLVPMFPHTLSMRPIVVDANSTIKISISPNNETAPRISCDGQERLSITPGSQLIISKKKETLPLLHPKDYQYYKTLRSKLHWGKKL